MSFTITNNNFTEKDGIPAPDGKQKLAGDGNIRINHEDSQYRKIHLPKIGWVKLKVSRELPENAHIISVTISYDVDKWYVSVNFWTHDLPSFNDKVIAIDVGVNNTITLSNGITFHMPAEILELEKQIEEKQRTFDKWKEINRKKWKDSGNKEPYSRIHWSQNMKDLRMEIAKLHKKIRQIRRNFLQQVTTWIAERYGYVIVEDLRIKNLTKSNKGTVDEPGKNRAQNKGKNRSIQRQGWGMMFNMLGYKTRVIKVDARYTSIDCSDCGARYSGARDEEDFDCWNPLCDNHCHADWNAAINIAERGLKVMRDEGITVPPHVYQDLRNWKTSRDTDLYVMPLAEIEAMNRERNLFALEKTGAVGMTVGLGGLHKQSDRRDQDAQLAVELLINT